MWCDFAKNRVKLPKLSQKVVSIEVAAYFVYTKGGCKINTHDTVTNDY